ncbi:hypothetical protein [Novacetimonas pomaceti]|uniref:hypothetical protein n=1 Tax=Novacetimonas pomaceti TaxID=2021998 RepID=UPI001C2DA954|nr:hypothetical protein [Novacetimonas pomaceti]MBV1835460.1 hypothetical protein [Novacetimonas pomaceti]
MTGCTPRVINSSFITSEYPDKMTLLPISSSSPARENVRLVIWDLDETFWQGTVTEGGYEYVPENHSIVIELANRGIISSICSKNDHEMIEAILREKGLWDYFVFPSIDWTAKGGRLKALVQASGLRPSTILFIDDNPMNLAEAQRFVEGIQVADPSIIPEILNSPLFKGKDDSSLSRLQQYKLLERRTLEMVQASDPVDFLRDSDIRIIIDHNVEANIDRAIELINRTNQLNFTKNRLPEDIETARNSLRLLLSDLHVQSCLVRVVDRYGDYGYVGFFAMWINGSQRVLKHYCFSCRILGMKVETWLYHRLGCPWINIVGEVRTDIKATNTRIDWMQLDDSAGSEISNDSINKVSRIVVRGGCDLLAVSHYFRLLTDDLIEEMFFYRSPFVIRLDHTQLLCLALSTHSAAANISLTNLGYKAEDFQSALTTGNGGSEIWLLAFWADNLFPLFRHRELGFRVPFCVQPLDAKGYHNFLHFNVDDLDAVLGSDYGPEIIAQIRTALIELQANYEYDGITTPDMFVETITQLLQWSSERTHIFILSPPQKDANGRNIDNNIKMDFLLRSLARSAHNLTVISIEDYIESRTEQDSNSSHFSRTVYFRLFEDIRTRIRALIES